MKNLMYPLLLTIFFIYSCKESSNKTSGEVQQIKAEETESTKAEFPKTSEKENTKNENSVNSEMVYFKGGEITIGSNDRTPEEYPAHKVSVKPFYIDKHLVTVADFREFIEATGFETEAHKYGDAGVYLFEINKWELVKGATWEYPLGPNKPKAKDDHPVTQVSWFDAVAYCKWAGKRLPKEAEWEFAARNGKNTSQAYSWGNEIFIDGRFKANTWQGELTDPQGADGYKLTSPVGVFGETESGLTDMGGNVWQWCADIFKPYPGNTQPYQMNEQVKVTRGGSFFFDQFGDLHHSVSFRAKNSAETSLFNHGFRCAKDAD